MDAMHVDCPMGRRELHVWRRGLESVLVCQWRETHVGPLTLNTRWMDAVHALSFVTMDANFTLTIRSSLIEHSSYECIRQEFAIETDLGVSGFERTWILLNFEKLALDTL